MIKICDFFDRSKSWYYDTLASREQVHEFENYIIGKVRKIRWNNPIYGTKKIHRQFARDAIIIGRDRLHRILKKHGMTMPVHYKKVRTSFPGLYEQGFNNLLKGLQVDHSNQVWCTDITYISTTEGILYLSVMMDLYSRKILSYNVSNNLRTDSSLECLNKALKTIADSHGIIHHSDHGVQYCSGRYLNCILQNEMQVSFTGPNHCYDNAKMERFFNTLKHEYALCNVIKSKKLAIELIKDAIYNYNNIRLHAALNYNTPSELYDAA